MTRAEETKRRKTRSDKKTRRPCARCGNPVPRSGSKYCGRTCSAEAARGTPLRWAAKDPVEHIRKRIVVSDEGCWLWQNYLNPNGYGEVNLAVLGRPRLTHQVTYENIVGPIPDGLELDHLCRNRSCCNPEHLEPVTHTENIRRGEWHARRSEWLAARTHCRSGHEYSAENTHITPEGRRRCRACARVWARNKYRETKKTRSGENHDKPGNDQH